jgi:hypothetical protein
LPAYFTDFKLQLRPFSLPGKTSENGLLEDKESLREEGTIIIAQTMRLMNLWDQILLYVGTYEDPAATCGR